MSMIFQCCLVLCVIGATLSAPADEKDRPAGNPKDNSHPAAHASHGAAVPQSLTGKTRAARESPPKPLTSPVVQNQQHPKPLILPATLESSSPKKH